MALISCVNKRFVETKKILIFIITLSCLATAAQIKNVAVVETEVDEQSGALSGLTPAEVRLITTELRREAVKNLPRGTYNIMTTETVYAQGGAVLEECADENCVIKLGSRIGADYIVRGIISKFQTRFTLSVEIYETEDGNLVASSDPVRSENINVLLEKTAAVCADMYRTFANVQSHAPVIVHPSAAQPQPKQAAQVLPSQSVGSGTPFTDSRDRKTYKTTVIGGKRWMAENLNYKPAKGKSWCSDNDSSNCAKYGRLYDWNTAMKACPAGWHLPRAGEWNNLVNVAGGKGVAGAKLKLNIGWTYGSGSGFSAEDVYGFSALPGGYRISGGDFYSVGYYGNWWTATESNINHAYSRYMSNANGYVLDLNYSKSDGLSVRCVQN